MAERGGKNMNPEDDRPLCLSCLHPNPEDIHFCEKCGAPLDSYASTAPFEQIYSQGNVFRAAAHGKPHLIVVFGVWLIFFPCVISAVILGPLSLSYSGSWGGALFFVFIGFLSAAFIFQSTKSYLASRHDAK